MAEKMLKKKVEELKLDIEVYSCGVAADNGDYTIGHAIDVMRERGINLKPHRATNIVDSNIQEMDLILCATVNHKLEVINSYPELKEKVFTIKEYAGEIAEGLDIQDPWGYGKMEYEKCAQELEICIDKIVKKL
ncbi:MAG: low molecular weight protein arginine phosphatase [Oscillospiraceae bacterium]|nr:low molecular weight protein arginine phosphatase [Oscillospiraceae bacterium]